MIATAALIVLVAQTAPDERCRLRAAAQLAGDSEPADVEALLESEHFVEMFAKFINTRFNRGTTTVASEDPVYYVVRHILQNHQPWSQLFVGQLGVSGSESYPTIVSDPAGIGYFTAPGWQRRYAGNDTEGAMLFAAYRIVQNTTGIVLVPSPFNAASDAGAVGREREPCASCHKNGPLALDKIANFLPRRTDFGARMTFEPALNEPQLLLNRSEPVRSLRELIEALVATPDFLFWSCRLVFEFTYGRPENACEAPVFDACVDALVATDEIRAAIAAVANDASFCLAE